MVCNSKFEFHQNQISLAEAILKAFQKGERYASVIAQMQSGKTGSYLRLCFRMIDLDMVDEVLIICGSREVGLKTQTMNALQKAMRVYIQNNPIIGEDQIDRINKYESRIKVYWNQDLKNINSISRRTLIVNDEAHTAASKSNIPYKKFWEKHNLSQCLYNDFNDNQEIFVCSISATNFAEITLNQNIIDGVVNHKLDPKHIFIMEVPSNYIGVDKLIKNGNLQYVSKSKIGIDDFEKRIESSKYKTRYCIIRTQTTKDEDRLERIASKMGFEYKKMCGANIEDINEVLAKKPSVTTIVHICGTLRMGRVLTTKTYIGLCYECSKNPSTDTALQALLGRMCGYDRDSLGVDIFISEKCKKPIDIYRKAFAKGNIDDLQSEISKVHPALNIKKNSEIHSANNHIKRADGEYFKKSIPIKLHNLKASPKSMIHADLEKHFNDFPKQICDHPDKDKILQQLHDTPTKKVGPHNLNEKTYVEANLKGRLNAAIANNEMFAHNFTNCVIDGPIVKPFIILYDNNTNENYLISWILSSEMTDDKWDLIINSTITLPKSIYHPQKELTNESGETFENVNGGQIIKFPGETSDDVDIFLKHLRECISLSKEYTSVSRAIDSLWDNKTKDYVGISLNNSIFTEKVRNEIIEKMKAEFGVSLKFQRPRGRPSTSSYSRYSKLSW